MTGVQTFGLQFVGYQYGVHTILANLLMLVVGAAAILGVLVAGRLSDGLVQRGHLNGRVLVAGVAAAATVVFFIPPLITTSPIAALPYITAAAFCLSAQNPALDAARLDIMPPLLWGRAEGIRTFLRTASQSVAPITFGGLSDLIGKPHHSLRITFFIMLLPFGRQCRHPPARSALLPHRRRHRGGFAARDANFPGRPKSMTTPPSPGVSDWPISPPDTLLIRRSRPLMRSGAPLNTYSHLEGLYMVRPVLGRHQDLPAGGQ